MSKHLSFKNTEIFYDKSSNNIKTKHILSTPLREATNLQPNSNIHIFFWMLIQTLNS